MLWDLDAWRPHIAAHSWVTLGYVALMTAGHLGDLMTINRLTVPCAWGQQAAE
jgi:hypothetical protein